MTRLFYQGQNLTKMQAQRAWLINTSSGKKNYSIETVDHLKRLATPYVDGMRHSFELVEGISSRLYVYGALWNIDNVRLISIMVQGYRFKNLLCVFYYTVDKSNPGMYVKPIVKELHTYKSPYTSASIKCPIKPDEYVGDVPLFVGLVESESDVPKQTFLVENLRKETGITHEFTVCVPALFHMTSAALLVQKVEMIRLFGAGRLVLYNASISSNVDFVLKMYAKEWAEGRETLEVVVLPWKLPMENNKPISIPYYAQQLAIDDCMYRYKRLSRYMAFNDLDEFLVPFKHDNWSTLVAERRRLKPRSIGWLFRCSVLNKDRPSPAAGFEDDYVRYGSAILGLTSRDKHVFPPNDRAKLIVDPTAIEEMGVHLIWEGRGTTDNIPVDVGMLLHYRVPLWECTPQVKETRVVDKYGKKLVARLKEIWSKLPGIELGWSPFKAVDKTKCKES
ncbi:UPF0392 protein F13G3.3-like isoform X2 [Elysia marginata]|uniref:Glycosyltransferase family 92 protein n=1 Tax=Elysia marginata TaxID=1093978 RepID=A0AAV4HRK3_9GAST|nr:UPF0392 protein F13G3.3-like isoform X2 [Elysia marginata]